MSDTDGKVKIYKHPERGQPVPYKPYVPQYQVEGVEPKTYQGAVVPGGSQAARPSADNPRLKKSPLRQPYATATTSSIGRGRGPVPNVGNNMEHTWSNVDGEIVDDLSGDPDQSMIDNNDFVTEQALGYQSGFTAEDIRGPMEHGTVLIEQKAMDYPASEVSQKETDPSTVIEDLLPIVADLADNSYLLIVSGVALCSGPQEEIEDQARALVFGEHEMCDGNPISIDDIIILKRVKMKVGLFLE